MRTRRVTVSGLLATLALLLVLVAAGTLPVAAQDPVPGSTIVVALSEEPDTLYVYGTSQLAARHVQQAFMDGPIDNRSFDYQPVILDKLPNLDDGDAMTQTVTVHVGERYVDEWDNVVTATQELVSMQMVVTFTLSAGILWSDGQPLTAGDSAFGFEVDCHPDTPTSKYVCDRTASYEAVNDQVAAWTSLPGFLDVTYFTRFWTPLPEHLLGDMTPGEILDSDYGRHPLGWGAFVVDEWVEGGYISLSRNPHYWRADLPAVERLVFRFIPNPDQALQALLRGEVHFITNDAADVDEAQTYLDLEAQGALDAHFSRTSTWEHIDFGIQPSDDRIPFFADPRVRQAVAFSTDRQAMIDAAWYGQTEILHSFIPPEHPFYPPPGTLAEYPYDPEAARALLDEVGWRDDDGDGVRESHGVVYEVPTWDWSSDTYGPTLTVTIADDTPFSVTFQTTSSEVRQLMGTLFQQDMAAIGISVTLEFPPNLFADGPDGPVFGRKFDVCEFAWMSGVVPPCDLYLAWQIPDEANGWTGQNDPGFVDPDYDSACVAAQDALRHDVRAGYFHSAQRIFSEWLPVLPLFSRFKVVLGNSSLLGIEMDPTADDLWNVEEWELSSWGQATAAGGGGVQSNDGRTTVTLDPGVISDTVTLAFTPWVVYPGGKLASTGHAFDLTAVYSDTGQPASLLPGSTFDLAIHYSEAELVSPMREETLALYAWDGDEWVQEPTSAVDMANNVVTAAPDHFSVWAVLGQTNRVYLPLIGRNLE
jgi:peptide/nickel transport system substrate-binding protein